MIKLITILSSSDNRYAAITLNWIRTITTKIPIAQALVTAREKPRIASLNHDNFQYK